ncbi:uncharacterized protein LOC126575650 [Anopheles aquasalis]|uniref:uncharacterized protein LOC126575650 n=1 Tax=Anopheles aquasalis TaxID=42839 RepID=UPI00215A1398|nr:uncharacterized protein LOC126575650 [Anopheles aquasalis]
MSEMLSLACETTIDSLPDEVLCMIFDHLSVGSVKTASLACRRWHDIIFLSSYSKRFILVIDINISYWKEQKGDLLYGSLWWELWKTMKRSQRCYRNIRWYMKEYINKDFTSYWKLFHPQCTENLSSLELHWPWVLYSDIQRLTPVLAASITQMTNLRFLSLTHGSSNDPLMHNFIPSSMTSNHETVLRSYSVQHLKISDGFIVTLDMPAIRSFEGPLCVLAQPRGSVQPAGYAHLKNVALTDGSELTAENKSFFQRFGNLVKIECFSDIDLDWLFSAICDTCSGLKELHFEYDISFDDPAT